MSFLSSVGNFLKSAGSNVEHGLEGAATGFLTGGQPGAIAGFVDGVMSGSDSNAASDTGVDFLQAMVQIEQSQTAEGDAGIDDWDA